MLKRSIVHLGYEQEEDYRNTCIFWFMTHLVRHAPFKNALNELEQYSLSINKSWEEVTAIGAVIEGQSITEDQSQCIQYRDKIEQLVSEYRLNPDWATERIHMGASDIVSLFMPPRLSYDDMEPKVHEILWSMDCGTNKDEIRKYILDKFNDQWDYAEFEAKDVGLIRVREKSALEEHTRWVFKKVCLKQKWSQIAEEEHRDDDAVRKAAQNVMKVLGLKSSNSRGGRPRND